MVDFAINVVVDTSKTQTGVKGVTSALGDAEKAGRNFGQTLTTALEAIVSFEAAKHLLEIAEAAETIDAKLRLVTGGEEELAGVTERLRSISHETGLSLEETASLFQQLTLSTKELGVSQEALFNFTRNLGVTIRASGASAGETSSAFSALSFAMSTGTLNGRALRSILNEIPTVGDAIADHLGVTRSGLKALGDEGSISAKDLFDSLDHVSQKTEELAQKSGKLKAAQNDLHNTLLQVVGDVDKATGTVHFLAEQVSALAVTWGQAALLIHNYNAETDRLNGEASKKLQFNAQINETIFALQNLEGRKVISDEALNQIEKLRQRLATLRGEAQAGFSTPVLGGGAAAPSASPSTIGAGVDLSGVVKAAQEQQHANEERLNGDAIRKRHNIEEITQKIEEQTKVQEDLLKGDTAAAEVDKLIDAQAQKDKKNKVELNDLDREKLILKQKIADAQRDEVKAYQDITGPLEEYKRQVTALQTVERNHPELAAQTGRALDNLKIKYDEGAVDFGSGVERAFLKMKLEAQDFAAVGEKALNAFADEATTAITKFAETGKFDLQSFTNAFLDDLSKILIRELVVAAISSLIPGLGTVGAGSAVLSGAHASGGTEQPGRSYLVGENGPELHTPGQTGSTAPIVAGNSAPPVVNVQVVNVDHPNKIPDAIASGAADQAIVNVLGRRRDQATKILSK